MGRLPPACHLYILSFSSQLWQRKTNLRTRGTQIADTTACSRRRPPSLYAWCDWAFALLPTPLLYHTHPVAYSRG